jgi:hypothetical protein
MGGIRIYYPEPHYFIQEQLGVKCCTIFKMKQRVPAGLLSDLRAAEHKDKKPAALRSIGLDLYANRLKDEIVRKTWATANRPLSQRITYEWPASPFEEWLDENVQTHWMTAEWFQESGMGPEGDFAFMISVHAPINCTQQEWDEAYGEAFVMTKLLHFE